MKYSTLNARAFTLIDLLITITILGILAAIVAPIVSGHLSESSAVAASSTETMVRKALDLYYQQHETWPPTLDPLQFTHSEPITMPSGWQLQYTPASGDLSVVQLTAAEVETAPQILIIE